MRALDTFKQCLKPENYDEIYSMAASYEVVSKNGSSLTGPNSRPPEIWYSPSSTSFEQLSIVSRDDFAEGRINVDLFEISNEIRDKLVQRLLKEEEDKKKEEQKPEQFPSIFHKKNPKLPYSKKSIKMKTPQQEQQQQPPFHHPLSTTHRFKSVRSMPAKVPEHSEPWEYGADGTLEKKSKPNKQNKRGESNNNNNNTSNKRTKRRGIFRFIIGRGRNGGKKNNNASPEVSDEFVLVKTIEGSNRSKAHERVLTRSSSHLSHTKISHHASDDTSEISYLIS